MAEVSTRLAAMGTTILDAQQHSDPDTGHFFMRYEVAHDEGLVSLRTMVSDCLVGWLVWPKAWGSPSG